MNPLDEVLCEVLIMEQLPAIQAEFEALLKSDVVEELARIYTILSRGNRAMEGVLTFTENFIRTKGLKAIAEIKDSAINVCALSTLARALSESNVTLGSRSIRADDSQCPQAYDDILDRAFGKDTRFIRALDVAHQSFINQNAVTDAARSSSKTSELLTRYVDSLLRKGGKNVEEQELDILLSDVVSRF